MEVFNAQIDANGNVLLVETPPDCDINAPFYYIDNQPQVEGRVRDNSEFCLSFYFPSISKFVLF